MDLLVLACVMWVGCTASGDYYNDPQFWPEKTPDGSAPDSASYTPGVSAIVDPYGSYENPVGIVTVNDTIYVFDGSTGRQYTGPNLSGESLDVAEIDGSPGKEAMVGTAEGKLCYFRFEDREPVAVACHKVSDEPVDSVRVADLDGDGSVEVLLVTEGALFVYNFDMQQYRWTSGYVGVSSDSQNSLAVQEIGGDYFDILLGTYYGIREYQGPDLRK